VDEQNKAGKKDEEGEAQGKERDHEGKKENRNKGKWSMQRLT
jgi:hypothetical protein